MNISGTILKASISNPRKTSKYIKGTVKRIIVGGSEVLQLALFTEKQVFHTNISDNDICAKLDELLNTEFMQCEVFTDLYVFGFRMTAKGKLLSNKRLNTNKIAVTNHNKDKKYLIKEGTVVPPLVDLKVMTPEGKVVKAYYDKYKQINKFLELIDSTIGKETKMNIIDFGCGKSYLTFILYYYLVEIKKMDVKIIGLDLKEDVIRDCNKIRDKYNYSNLNFEIGDISLYKPSEQVDMIITLHACDTATDFALYHAIKLNSKYIFSVPCCQHEINLELKSDKFTALTKYGLLKERFSALYTDAIRANILEFYGYKVNVMEFIDFTHSPKNILIKAVKDKSEKQYQVLPKLKESMEYFGIEQTLYKLLEEEMR